MTQAQPAFHLLHPSQQQTQSRQPPPQSAAPFPHPGTLSSHSTQSLQPAQSQSQPNGNGAPWGGPFPALHLWPIHDTFVMKMIHLPDQQRVGCFLSGGGRELGLI